MKFFYLFLPLLLVGSLAGQTDPVIFQSGSLRASFGPGGALQSPDGEHFLTYEVVDGITVPLVRDAGVLVGGLDPGGNLVFHEVRGGANTPGWNEQAGIPLDYWRVTREEIEQHKADFADNGVIDNPIEAIYAWPGRFSAFFSEYNGFELDLPNTLTGFAPFWDNDLDNAYEPDAGDYPLLTVRGCDPEVCSGIIPAEMVFFPFVSTPVDAGMPIDFQLIAFRFDCTEETVVNNTIFLQYRSNHRSVERVNDNYFGLYVDGDIGCSLDDYVGTFPERDVAYFYNADAQDEGCPGVNSYLDLPPALGVDILRTPMDPLEGMELGIASVMPLNNPNNGNAPVATTEYTTPLEAYNYLAGKWRDGSDLLDEGNGYNDGGQPTAIAFPGDPNETTGWSEFSAGNTPGDRRVLMSTPSESHFPGAINELIVAFSMAYDSEADHREQVTVLRDQVDQVQTLFDNCFIINENSAPFTGCSPIVTSARAPSALPVPAWDIFPNPARESFALQITDNTVTGELVVFDALGHPVLATELTLEQQVVHVKDLPAGVYSVQLRLDDGRMGVKRLVVQ